MRKQQILIVDDSPFVRRMLQDWISGEPDLEICGIANNGKEGVELAAQLKPDIVTLDVEMPIMTGLEALPKIIALGSKVLMCSSVTTEGANATLQALEAGAYDFVTKPQGGSSLKFVEAKSRVLEKIRTARYAKVGKQVAPKKPKSAFSGKSDKVILVASSTGGPKTLKHFFEALPVGFPSPILIVQHMPAAFTKSLADRLNSVGTVPCIEATEGMGIEPGRAYLAPGGLHMVVTDSGTIALNESPTLHGVRPAADYLFKSAVAKYGSRCIGAVLTGMGKDGADGAVEVRKAGGVVFGECEESCVVYGMPKAAMQAGGIDAEFRVERIPAAIISAMNGGQRRAS